VAPAELTLGFSMAGIPRVLAGRVWAGGAALSVRTAPSGV
jgi:hypothetical protein